MTKKKDNKNDKVIDINLTLPRTILPGVLKKTASKLKRRYSVLPRRIRSVPVVGVGIVIVLGVAFGTYRALENKLAPTQAVASQVDTQPDIKALQKGVPEYNTILPEGKKIEDLGGWTRVSPADKNPVFAYVDRIGTSPINVSQQPLPEDFKTDTAIQVEELAKSFNARSPFKAGNTVAYVGTSAKGPQSVIFTKDGLLVLIKSSVKIEEGRWAEYIATLH